MIEKERHHLRLATFIVPWNKGDRRMKVVLLHFRQKTLIVDIAIRLTQPWVVDCKVGVIMKGVPAVFAGGISCKDHRRCDFEKGAHDILALSNIASVRCVTCLEYYLASNHVFNKNRARFTSIQNTLDRLPFSTIDRGVIERLLSCVGNLKTA